MISLVLPRFCNQPPKHRLLCFVVFPDATLLIDHVFNFFSFICLVDTLLHQVVKIRLKKLHVFPSVVEKLTNFMRFWMIHNIQIENGFKIIKTKGKFDKLSLCAHNSNHRIIKHTHWLIHTSKKASIDVKRYSKLSR